MDIKYTAPVGAQTDGRFVRFEQICPSCNIKYNSDDLYTHIKEHHPSLLVVLNSGAKYE